MITAGKKTARATAIRFVKPKDTLGFQVRFDYKEADGSAATLYWTGWVSEKAQKQTIKTLNEVLEWNGDDSVVQVPESDPTFGFLSNQDSINRKKDVELDVQPEPYTAQDGTEKVSMKIRWVNNIGGGQFAGCSPQVVKNDLDASGFRAAFLSAKQGKPTVAATLPTGGIGNFPPPTPQNDLPF